VTKARNCMLADGKESEQEDVDADEGADVGGNVVRRLCERVYMRGVLSV
jgi:hypothetical protein